MTLPPREVAYVSRKITCPDDDSRARPKYLRCVMSVAALSHNSEPPQRRAARVPLSILFSDIEGSTALNETLGDERWVSVLAEHHEIIREQIRRHGGREVKTLGDGFMIVFTSADDALDCAVCIQRAFDERNRSRSPAIRVRIGVHTGAAIHLAGDFVGRDVALAARITGQARGGQIIVSDVTSLSTEDVAFAFRALPATSLDGFQQTFRLHRLEWDARPALRAIAGGTLGSS
jgi:class 3 adenylate cyclase